MIIMSKRFANYEWAIKHSGGTVGGELQKYLDFKTGTRKVTRTATAPTGGDAVAKGLTPFTIDITAGALHIVSVVPRQTSRANAIGLTEAELGLAASAGTHLKYSLRPATINGAKGTAESAKISQITGLSYNKKTGDAFSIPFGIKTAGDKMGTRFSELVIIAKAADSGCSISYSPERLLR